MVDDAVAFAVEAHKGAFRKGTKVPYIVHPLEAAVIVSMISEDEDLICAALLHDVVEDAGVTKQQLEALFGSRVTAYVIAETEDKAKSWKERKAVTLKHLETASRERKILILGDKLSNLRCTARDYMLIGEKMWDKFNEKRKSEHAWYYTGVADRITELGEHPLCQEYFGLCRKIFGDW